LLKKAERWITEKPDEIITSSHDLESFFRENFQIKGKISTIKDYPDTSIYHPNVEPASINLPEGKSIAAYLGGLQPYKGIEYLLRAIPYVDERFHFLIMGDPPEIWFDLVKHLGIEKRITFTGSVKYDEAPRYLKLAKVGLAPKTLESKETNGKIYQYAAMGLPTVCFDIPENREILSGEDMVGYFAKEKDVEDFARLINQIP
jgi:glycosyltransferase involved in cell wall biosynthesis